MACSRDWRSAWIGFALMLAGCAGLSGPIEPPTVSLVDLRVLDAGLFEQRYGLKLRLQNPNPVEMPIAGMAYRVSLNDIEFGSGVSRQATTLAPYAEEVVEVEVVSNVFTLLSRLKDLKAGRGQSLRIAITGGVNLANRAGELPFALQGELGGPGE